MEASFTGWCLNRSIGLRRLVLPLCAAVSTGVCIAQDISGAPPALDVFTVGFPGIQLPARVQGDAAVKALGNRLPEVAAFYGNSPEELAQRLRQDHHLWIDQAGRLVYVCEWKAKDEPQKSEAPSILAAPYPDEETFLLHSRPGANRVIYLDFDGVDASKTSWGQDAIGRAFDTDGNPFSFSSAERAVIQGVWQRVSEDYAMYDVDVTTEDPGTEALRKSSASDVSYGIRVAVSGSSSDWYGSAGGVAYVGSFNSSSDIPCWVFPGSLSNTEKNIAEATSHEVGHTLGLSHDGKDVGSTHTEYYSGHGNWAPIMGVGYSKPITHWSRGEYANANQKQDDLTVMLNYGVAYRSDDHGGFVASATPVSGVSFSIPGNIERAVDVDYFSFRTGPGGVTLTATPAPKGPNLHIQLSLYNESGALLATANPADTSAGTQSATISRVLTAGKYYVSVQGVGSGDPLSTGYSDYASIGEYTFSGSLPSNSGWIAAASGAYSWINTANWAAGSYPLGSDAIARLENNIDGDQLISLETEQILGGLALGDADSSSGFHLQAGAAGFLTFASSSSEAWIQKSTGGQDQISVPVLLDSSVVISNGSLANLLFSGSISGNGGVRKEGAGNVVLETTNSFKGDLVVASGRLTLGAAAGLTTPGIHVASGAELDVQPLGGLTLALGQALGGQGTVSGSLTVPNGAIVAPGSNELTGILHVNGSLNFSAGARLRTKLNGNASPNPGACDAITIQGDLNVSGPVSVEITLPQGVPLSPGIYEILTYSGTFTGSAASFQVIASQSRFSYTFDDSVPGSLRLLVSGTPSDLVWKGDGTLNSWDVGLATNWTADAGPGAFYHLDRVVFDDSGLNTPAISLRQPLEAGSVTVDAARDYIFSGSGRLTGSASLLKKGEGTLSVAVANDYLGATSIEAGTLKVANSSALGGTNSGTTVSPGATLDLNGFDINAEPLVLSGSGVLDRGALVNNLNTTRSNAVRFLSLSGDTVLGGIGRWDLRARPTAKLLGNGFNLTKTGNNEIWLADGGPSGLGNISVEQGTLGFEGTTTLGISTRIITIFTNATLALWQTADNALLKNMVLSGGHVNSMHGFNSFNGAISLTGSNVVTAGSSLALRGNIFGAGSLTKLGGGTLMLTGANTYTGETWIQAGSVETYSSTALGSPLAGTTITSGGRLDVRGNNLGIEPITVSGTGLGNAGAIVNTGSSQQNALRFVTLSGATTFGGINRWDIRANPTGSLTGNNFALTKRGKNEVWLVDLGATGLGSITIYEGLLGFQGSTTLGNAASTLTVNSGASVGFYGSHADTLTKNLSLSSGRIFNSNGANQLSGNLSLAGSNRVDTSSGTSLTINGTVSGSGTLYKLGTGTLVMNGTGINSGATHISSGTFRFGNGGPTGSPGTGAITNSGTLVFFRNNVLLVNNTIAGSGVLHIGVVDNLNSFIGSTVVLRGPNYSTGNVFVYGNGNMLALGNDNCLGSGTLYLNGNNNGDSLSGVRSENAIARTVSNNVQLGGGNRFQFGSFGTGDLVFNGPRMTTDAADKTLFISNNVTTIDSDIVGSSRLIKSGPGTLVLNGNNTNGPLVIEMGTVRINSELRLGPNPPAFNSAQLAFNGGTLQSTASMVIDDPNRGIFLMPDGGTIQVDPGLTVTLARPIGGVGGLRKTGSGVLQLSGLNTFSGGVTNLEGSLIINGLVQGESLVIADGTLAGLGRVLSPVLVEPSGTIAPGLSIGTLTISNALHLAGTTIMEVDAGSKNSDLIAGMTSVLFGGGLVVNCQGTPQKGDVFKLFDAVSYTGQFASIILPPLGPDVVWDTTRLAVDGTLRVNGVAPAFSSTESVDGEFVFGGSGGKPGVEYVVRASTNAALPVSQWEIISTNYFDATGSFRMTNEIDPQALQKFYLIQSAE